MHKTPDDQLRTGFLLRPQPTFQLRRAFVSLSAIQSISFSIARVHHVRGEDHTCGQIIRLALALDGRNRHSAILELPIDFA